MNEYEVTPVDQVALHDLELPAGCWWACEYPERPFGDGTWYDWRCHGCVRHAEATVALVGDVTQPWAQYVDGGTPNDVPLAEMVRRSKGFLGLP